MILASLYCLILSNLTYACTGGQRQLTKADVAFAEIIFEGRIREVKSGEYLFDVVKVIKGNLDQEQVLVGLMAGVAFSPPKSREEFISRYGELSRIALTTPEQIRTLCKVKKTRSITFRDGANVITYVDKLECENSLLEPRYARTAEIPFIVRRTCGFPYIFDVEKYSKMENYKENLKKFEYLVEKTLANATYDRLELYQVITGGTGPLPWEMNGK